MKKFSWKQKTHEIEMLNFKSIYATRFFFRAFFFLFKINMKLNYVNFSKFSLFRLVPIFLWKSMVHNIRKKCIHLYLIFFLILFFLLTMNWGCCRPQKYEYKINNEAQFLAYSKKAAIDEDAAPIAIYVCI